MSDVISRPGISRRSALQTAILGAGATVATAGCNPKDSAAHVVDEAVEWAKANLPNSTADIVRGAAKEGHLTLTMLNQGGNTEVLKKLIEGFNKRYPFIAVESTAQSTLQLVNKFNAELSAKKGTTDYINFPSNLHTTAMLEKRGAILPFVISQDAAFPAAAKRPGGLWYAWRTEYPSTGYRKGALNEEERRLIQTFEGLSDPRFKNRIGIPSITNSATAAGCYILMKQYPRGWEGLAANNPRVKPTAPALIDGLLAGEYDITVMAGMIGFIGAARDGAPIEFGVSAPFPPVYTPGGISTLAPHPNAAKLWQDWVMSTEGQNILVETSGLGAARTGLNVTPWSEQQAWYFRDKSRQTDIDWDDFAQKQSEMIARFKKEIQKG